MPQHGRPVTLRRCLTRQPGQPPDPARRFVLLIPEAYSSMEIVIGLVLAIAGTVGMVFLLRHYRRQADWERGPGEVPEDYS